jgi:hypothetical protein
MKKAPQKHKLWICDQCAKLAPWSKSWRHYPGLLSVANVAKADTVYPMLLCSKTCEDAAFHEGGVVWLAAFGALSCGA